MYKIIKGKKVYDEDISCVVDPVDGKGGIFIGNLQASQNIKTLQKFQIKAVLTSCAGVLLDHPKTQVPYYLYIPAQDHPQYDLSKHFDKAAHFIKDCLSKTNILVHCMAGISRSVSLVFAYMMKFEKKSYKQIYTQIKYRRSIIQPNSGFERQLKKYEDELKGTEVEKRGNSVMAASRKESRENMSQKYSGKHIWTVENIHKYPINQQKIQGSRKKVFSQYNQSGNNNKYKYRNMYEGNLYLSDQSRERQIEQIRKKYYYESTISSKHGLDRNGYKHNPEVFRQKIEDLEKKYENKSKYFTTQTLSNSQNVDSSLTKDQNIKKQIGKIRSNMTGYKVFENYQRNFYKSKI